MSRHSRGYFEGYYFKHQAGGRTVSFIPACHVDGAGRASCSVQVITDQGARMIELPQGAVTFTKRPFGVAVGGSRFALSGIKVDLRPYIDIHGEIKYGPITALPYDIMGPFSLMPGMQCRHSVQSLSHRLDGALHIDGERIDFSGGVGYIEGDRGTSFPDRYAWTQSSAAAEEASAQGEPSLMLSVASIPILGTHFMGCIGVILMGGEQQLRLATYLGSRVELLSPKIVRVRQGRWTLTCEPMDHVGHELRAPVGGAMHRLVRESASCRVRYRLMRGGETLLDTVRAQASFEFSAPGV